MPGYAERSHNVLAGPDSGLSRAKYWRLVRSGAEQFSSLLRIKAFHKPTPADLARVRVTEAPLLAPKYS